MLSRKNKVTTELFKKVLKNGKNTHFKYFSLNIMKISEKESKFSFVVSKKIAKKAVERNFLKRRGFNIIEEIINEIPPSLAIIFFFKKEVLNLSFSDLKKEIKKILSKEVQLRGGAERRE